MTRRRYTDEDLGRIFSVDLETGTLSKWGSPAFHHHDRRGYVYVTLRNRSFLAHRLIWFLVHGRWPLHLDHINGMRGDNRLSNLREVTVTQNLLNPTNKVRTGNKAGVTGVSLYRDGRWRAYISTSRKRTWLGSFATMKEAIEARKKAEGSI